MATAVAEQAPELVAELVYVSGMAPVSGISAAEYNVLAEMSDSLLMANIVADPAATGALRCDFDDLSRRGHARQTLYNDLSDDHASRALSLLCSDAPVAIGVEKLTVSRTRYGAVPHTYVVCNRDNALRPALQRRLISEIDAVSTTETTVAELDTSHSPFLSQPQALADIFAATHRRIRASA